MTRKHDAPPQVARLHIRLLGPVSLSGGGVTMAPLPYDKVRALLACLVLDARRPLPRAQLADLLWPDADPADARANLRHALHSLRRGLGQYADCLVAGRDTLLFVPGDTRIDVLDFLSDDLLPETRLALYRGEFLEALTLDDCPAWLDWCSGWRQTLLQRVRALLATLSAEQQCAGEWDRAQATLQRWLALIPWDEEPYRRLMRLALDRGDPDTARQWYERCEQALSQELEVAPSVQTRALLDDVPTDIPAPGNHPLAALHLELPACPRADPEQEARRLAVCRQLAEQSLRREGAGHCVTLPDGALLAYFGYPQSSEYAVRRAVEAARRIGRQLTDAGEAFAIGVHAGLAPVAERPDTAGLIAGNAGRLARSAALGETLLSDAVAARLGGWLPLLPGPQPRTHLLLIDAEADWPLYGRDVELRQIERQWLRVYRRGHMDGLLISADPGYGKSALVGQVCRWLRRQTQRVVLLQCAEHDRHHAFRPLLDWLSDQAGLALGQVSQDISVALGRWLADKPGGEALLPVLRRFFLAGEEGWAAIDDPPRRLAEALACLLGDSPLCLVIEDLHWCDEASLETLSLLRTQPALPPLYLLATTRPQPRDTLALPLLWLSPLPEAAMRAVIARAAGDRLPDEALQRQILNEAAGVPLYAEEMTHLWRSSERAGQGGADLTAVSGRILDMVAARLSRMGGARWVAQWIAAAGTAAEPALLAALCEGRLPLADCLEALRAEGVLVADSDSLRFRHALIHDAVYATLGHSERRALHARLADWLARERPALVQRQPVVLARHLSAAQDPRAAEVRLRAVHQTAANAAWQDVLGQLPALAEDIERVREPALRRRLERQAALLEGGASIALRGDGDAAGAAAYQRARALCTPDDQDDLFMAAWGCWQVADATQPTDVVHRHARELLQLAVRSGVPAQRRQACFATGISRMFAGNLRAAQHWLQRAMRETDGEDVVFGPDSHSGCQSLVGYMQCLRGQPEAALQSLCAATARAEQLDHAWSSAYVQDVSMLVYLWRGEPEQVLRLAAALRRGAGRAGMRFWLRFGLGLEGVARTMLGDAAGLAALDETLAMIDEAHPALRIIFHPFRAEALWHLGRDQECLVAVEESLRILARYHSTFGLPELWRRRAACQARQGLLVEARAAAQQARRLAEIEGAGMTLARLQELSPSL